MKTRSLLKTRKKRCEDFCECCRASMPGSQCGCVYCWLLGAVGQAPA